MRFPQRAALLALALAAAPAAAQELPRAHAPRPTTTAITAADLMTRLYVLADDSMMGRQSGTRGNVMGTAYVEAELRRLGLEPAGENGTFFQTIPLVRKGLHPGARLSVDGADLRAGTDFVPIPPVEGTFRFDSVFRAQGVPVVFGGRVGDENAISREQARGKFVVVLPPLNASGQPEYRFWRDKGLDDYPGAAGIAVVSLDVTTQGVLRFLSGARTELAGGAVEVDGAPGMIVSNAAAARLLGADPATLRPGAAGRTVSGAYSFAARPVEHPARNVVAILRGSDPALRGEYVAITAHNDHDGLIDRAIDHDSVRAYNRVMRIQGANDPVGAPTPEQAARIAALRDSLRRAHGGVRPDSVMNGAIDDGSGTVVLLEIAEELARAPRKPRRSLLFVSHTAEEMGLYGSRHFTDHPTVPRESIVAALNMDMVGGGPPNDFPGRGPNYIQLIGSRRLSTQLGDAIDRLNGSRPVKMEIDYSFDAPGHPLNRYCRSDHFMYARYGIPITYFSQGYTIDYHMVSDEPQYIDYPHMERVAHFVRDIALEVANRDRRLVVDGPRPDPNAPCRQ